MAPIDRLATEHDFLAALPRRRFDTDYVEVRRVHRVLPLPLEGVTLETYLYWSENSAADAANHWLRERVREAMMPTKKIEVATIEAARRRA